MKSPNFLILYVDNLARSTAFYSELLARKPVDASPAFAMFALDSGMMFGLWSRHDVQPKAQVTGGGGEVAFEVKDGNGRVDEICRDWRDRGFTIAQQPCKMDFGYTFVALDPDQHRVRVFAPCGS